MNNITLTSNCYGCYGCASICKYGAISFSKNHMGFYFPVIDETKCINCGRCSLICNKDVQNHETDCAYILETKNKNVHLSSSSGGAFFHIAEAFLNVEKSIVFAARYDENLEVKHDSFTSISDIKGFQKSKYVCSDLTGVFNAVHESLCNNYNVLFCGTPCQVAGLKKYLPEDFERLTTIDLICSGVMSPILLKRTIEKYSIRMNVTGFDWRYKHQEGSSWNIMDSCLIVDGKKFQTIDSIRLKRLYAKRYCYMESCYHCKYASKMRCSDITLGDYWNDTSAFSGKPNMGSSAVVINTSKGKSLFDRINTNDADLLRIDLELIFSQNPAMNKCAVRPTKNDVATMELEKMDISQFLRKYTKNSCMSRCKMLIARLLPKTIVQDISSSLKEKKTC